jgi:hypothetical protein
MRLANGAETAIAARRTPSQDDVVADCRGGDALTHGLDDAGTLVTEQVREIVADAPQLVMQIGVAHAAGLYADQHLARPRWIDKNFLYVCRFSGATRYDASSCNGHP